MKPLSRNTEHGARWNLPTAQRLHVPKLQHFNASTLQRFRAFTLIELLVVISIVAILAALSMPVINNFKPNVVQGATRQLLDDVHRARQLAISQRTTVYMVFVPTNFWNGALATWSDADKRKATNLFDKQLIAYNFITARSLGDQPGRRTPRYLSSWRTLPEGVYIAPQKFGPRTTTPVLIYTNVINSVPVAVPVYGFSVTNNAVPFPGEDTLKSSNPNAPYVTVPYIAFNYLGQLTSGQNELIPLVKGSVFYSRQPATGAPIAANPTYQESPVGNVTNAFNVVSIDWLTGRARLEHQQIQ